MFASVQLKRPPAWQPILTGIGISTIAIFVALGVAGSLAGTTISPRIPERPLRATFAALLTLAAITIVVVEVGFGGSA